MLLNVTTSFSPPPLCSPGYVCPSQTSIQTLGTPHGRSPPSSPVCSASWWKKVPPSAASRPRTTRWGRNAVVGDVTLWKSQGSRSKERLQLKSGGSWYQVKLRNLNKFALATCKITAAVDHRETALGWRRLRAAKHLNMSCLYEVKLALVWQRSPRSQVKRLFDYFHFWWEKKPKSHCQTDEY